MTLNTIIYIFINPSLLVVKQLRRKFLLQQFSQRANRIFLKQKQMLRDIIRASSHKLALTM